MTLALFSRVWGACGLLLAFSAQAQTPQQRPVTLVGDPPPNIVVTLDDSGSMGATQLLIPGRTPPNSQIRQRSPAVNALYYDFTRRYQPWIKPDGTRCTAANPNAVLTEGRFGCGTGYNAGAPGATTNLSTLPDTAYWRYNSGSYNVNANYTFVQIGAMPAATTFPRPATRTDCVTSPEVCTRAEELQNYANWHQYYRTSMLMARGALGEAFYDLSPDYRVGYALLSVSTTTINGQTYDRLRQGVGAFTGTQKENWYKGIYNTVDGGGTPLISVTREVSDYFLRTDNGGPWGFNPPSNAAGTQYTCRRNFHILMTDGVWGDSRFNPPPTALGGAGTDVDGTEVALPDGSTYTPGPPYRDCNVGVCAPNRGFLADAGFYYWSRDLRPDMTNNLSPTATNSATWQHLVTYTIGLGQNGNINSGNIANIYAGTANWGSNAIDDLWHMAINGRGQYFAAQDPVSFGQSFRAALADIARQQGRTAGTGVGRSTASGMAENLYLSSFTSNIWSGDIQGLSVNSSVSPPTTAELWLASKRMPAPANRQLFTHNGTNGVAFTWANLTSTQKGSFSNDEAAFNFIRGVWTLEQQFMPVPLDPSDAANAAHKYRSRETISRTPAEIAAGVNPVNLVGGILGSRPVLHKAGGTEPDVLYVASTAGMLHAFGASNGVELFAYVPGMIYNNLFKSTRPDYNDNVNFNRLVDGTPAIQQVDGVSYLVSSLGTAGKGIYALNVSQPSTFGAGKVLWEKTTGSGSDFSSHLGYAITEGRIVKVYDSSVPSGSRVVVLLPNGVDSTDKKAGVFVIDASTGALVRYINTNVGSSTLPNGLTGVSIRTNPDGYLQYAYGGDIQGNVWKFDFTSTNSSDWKILFSGVNGSPLFSSNKPITVPIAIGARFSDQSQGVMLYWGSGRLLTSVDADNTDTQTFFALWDNDSTIVSSLSELKQQTLTDNLDGTFVTSGSTVNYGTQRGWYMNFLQGGERTLVGAIPRKNTVLFETYRPSNEFCQASGSGSALYSIGLQNGKTYHSFDVNNDGVFDFSARLTATGNNYVTDKNNGNPYFFKEGSTAASAGGNQNCFGPNGQVVSCNDGGGGVLRRVRWRELIR
ncbi:MAG: pilus assembly protein [Curvibacter sp.]